MNRRDFLIRLGLAVPAVKTVVCFGTGIWRPTQIGIDFASGESSTVVMIGPPGVRRRNFSIYDTSYERRMLAKVEASCGIPEMFMGESAPRTATEMMTRLEIQHQKARYRGTIRVDP